LRWVNNFRQWLLCLVQTSRMSAHLGRITLLNAPRRRSRSFRLRQILLGSEPDSAFRHFVTSMPAPVTFGLSGCPTTSTSSIPQISRVLAELGISEHDRSSLTPDRMLVRMASGRAAQLTRRSALCRTCCGRSDFIGCSISIYASISIRFRTLTFERSSTDESRMVSSGG